MSSFDPYNKNSMKMRRKQEVSKEKVEDIKKLPSLEIESRGITEKTAKHFGIKVAVSPEDGETHIAHYFPYTKNGEIVGYKKRDLTKSKKEKFHFTTVGEQGVDCQLFGTSCGNATGGKKIWITEGEYDAAICWQVLKDKWPRSNPTVVSIGSGTANAVKNIGQKTNMRYIKQFNEIILAFDSDKATKDERERGIRKGKDAVDEVYGLIPDIYIADFPDDKDPCDLFNDIGSEQLYWLLMKPINYTPEGFVKYEDVREKALELPKMGRNWPWPTMTKYTLGRRDGEGIYIGAGTKMGKSEFANKLIEHITTTEKDINGNPQKVAVFKFEEQPEETLKKVAGKFFKKDFVNPERVVFINSEGKEVDVWGEEIKNREIFFTQEELREAIDSVGNNLILYNNYGRCHWEELKGAIRHAVLVEHVKDIFIDPITRLTAGMSASDANTELETFADEISKMSQDLGFTYYCFCHLKAPPPPAKPHEMGGKVFSSQFRGSRAMQQACHYMIGLEGNKDPEIEHKIQNTRYIKILEDRKHGRTGIVTLFYDVETGDFSEPPKGFMESEYQTLREFYEAYPNGYDGGNTEDF